MRALPADFDSDEGVHRLVFVGLRYFNVDGAAVSGDDSAEFEPECSLHSVLHGYLPDLVHRENRDAVFPDRVQLLQCETGLNVGGLKLATTGSILRCLCSHSAQFLRVPPPLLQLQVQELPETNVLPLQGQYRKSQTVNWVHFNHSSP